MRRYLLSAAGLALIGIAAIGIAQYEKLLAMEFFVSALQSAHVHEEVDLGGVHYLVSDGLVYKGGDIYEGPQEMSALRTAYEKAVARRTPLFSLAGTDPERLLAAIQQLQDTEVELSAVQKSSGDASLVRSSLYPIDFLDTAARLEQARQVFLQSGTPKDADAYEELLYQTESAYQRTLADFRTAFEYAVPAGAGEYATEHDLVSPNSVRAALQTLSNDAQQASAQVERRMWCMHGVVELCDPADVEFPSPEDTSASAVGPAQISQAGEIHSLLSRAGIPLATSTVELQQSACLEDNASPLFTLSSNETAISYVGDVRFVPSSRYPDIPFYAYFAEQGVEFVPSSPVSYYECPNVGQDWGNIFGIEEIASFAERSSLNLYTSGERAAQLTSLEESFKGPLLTEKDALLYLGAAQSLAEEGNLPPEIENDIISLSLAMKDGSTDFDLLVSNVAHTEATNVALSQSRATVDLGIEYLFFVRSAFVPFFFGDNTSLSPSNAFFPYDTIPATDTPFVFYSTLPHTQAIEEHLTHDIGFYYQLHHE